MAKTTKQAMKQVRQINHRQKLSEGKHLQYAIESIEKIEKLKPSETSTFELSKLKIASELRLKLVDKFLPSLKGVELGGRDGEPIKVAAVSFNFLPVDSSN
ncbi:MAG: hypothetical protein JKY22_12355 [Flavobacteriaceae bacterium]|nr:hypothetical protein [Flavobacteriaceae bacterium]